MFKMQANIRKPYNFMMWFWCEQGSSIWAPRFSGPCWFWCEQGSSIWAPRFQCWRSEWPVGKNTPLDPATMLLFKIKHSEMPLSYYTGVFGISSLTAYFGHYDVAKSKKGDCVFILAAAGVIGQIVGQLAKLTGCYVVGNAGSDEKVNLLKTKFGFDDACNYKERAEPQRIIVELLYFVERSPATRSKIILKVQWCTLATFQPLTSTHPYHDTHIKGWRWLHKNLGRMGGGALQEMGWSPCCNMAMRPDREPMDFKKC